MSHGNISLPITLQYTGVRGTLIPWQHPKRLTIDDGSVEYYWRAPPPVALLAPMNPWELREDFLGWPLEYWQGFFEMAGGPGPFRVSKVRFAAWQKLLREALLRPAREWRALEAEMGVFDPKFSLSTPLTIAFQWKSQVPQAVVLTHSSLVAILATIQIDKLQGAEFRVCARHDCKSPPFRAGTRHKIFCDAACAHLVAVRKSRERFANSKSNTTKKVSTKPEIT